VRGAELVHAWRWPRRVRVRYTAGYESPFDVPARARQVALQLATHWYENRLAGDELPGELRTAIQLLSGPVVA
jgi:hypothetical protein